MRGIALACALVASIGGCKKSEPEPAPDGQQIGTVSYSFGPFTIAPSQEVSDQCIQITLHNDAPIYVNQVELTTGPGFHHSNWFYVPENKFVDVNTGDNSDTTFKCDDRNYTEPAAALFGGVLFAQSTQAPHEVQGFPAGVAIKIPPHSKLFAQIHLLNTGDAPLDLAPTVALTSLAADQVTTLLAAVSFENQALALPPNSSSRFTIDCDLATKHQELLGTPPNFKLYYGLGHYHALGTKVEIDAVKTDGTVATMFTTEGRAGDVLGGPIDPLFDFTGYSTLRFTCEYTNPRPSTVHWGIGDQEMCVFLAFSDSTYNWAGGVTSTDAAGPSTLENGMPTFHHACNVYGLDATH